jgi:hypothetical protein
MHFFTWGRVIGWSGARIALTSILTLISEPSLSGGTNLNMECRLVAGARAKIRPFPPLISRIRQQRSAFSHGSERNRAEQLAFRISPVFE